MISSKEYAKMMAETCGWARSEGMQKHFESSVLYAEELSAGVVEFDKPHLETSFCYGYGMFGGTQESASELCDSVESDYNMFLAENLDQDGSRKWLKEIEENPDDVYLGQKYDEGKMVFFRVLKPWDNKEGFVKATPEDVEKIKAGLKAQIDNLTKRCATYWKRFGGSKLKTWTYWADE